MKVCRPKAYILSLAFLTCSGCATYSINQDTQDGSAEENAGQDGGSDAAADTGSGRCERHQGCPADQRCFFGECLTDPPPCGEEPNPSCNWDLSEEACGQNSGQWFCSALDLEWCGCDCYTGDSGCPCWRASHCEGICRGLDDRNGEACEATEVGFCSETRGGPYGCYCVIFFDNPDRFMMVCVD